MKLPIVKKRSLLWAIIALLVFVGGAFLSVVLDVNVSSFLRHPATAPIVAVFLLIVGIFLKFKKNKEDVKMIDVNSFDVSIKHAIINSLLIVFWMTLIISFGLLAYLWLT